MSKFLDAYTALSAASPRSEVAAVLQSITDGKSSLATRFQRPSASSLQTLLSALPLQIDDAKRQDLIQMILDDLTKSAPSSGKSSKSRLSSKDATQALQAVKALGKNPAGSEVIASSANLSTLLGLSQSYKDNMEASHEALRCIANALLLVEQARVTFITKEVGGGEAVVELLEKSAVPERIFLASRILFLCTVSMASARGYIQTLVEAKSPGSSGNIVEIIGSRLDILSKGIMGTSKLAREAMTDLLKFTFNLLLHYPKIVDNSPHGDDDPPVMGDCWSDRLDGSVPSSVSASTTDCCGQHSSSLASDFQHAAAHLPRAPRSAHDAHNTRFDHHSCQPVSPRAMVSAVWPVLDNTPSKSPSPRESPNSSPESSSKPALPTNIQNGSPTKDTKPGAFDRAWSALAAGRRSLSRSSSPLPHSSVDAQSTQMILASGSGAGRSAIRRWTTYSFPLKCSSPSFASRTRDPESGCAVAVPDDLDRSTPLNPIMICWTSPAYLGVRAPYAAETRNRGNVLARIPSSLLAIILLLALELTPTYQNVRSYDGLGTASQTAEATAQTLSTHPCRNAVQIGSIRRRYLLLLLDGKPREALNANGAGRRKMQTTIAIRDKSPHRFKVLPLNQIRIIKDTSSKPQPGTTIRKNWAAGLRTTGKATTSTTSFAQPEIQPPAVASYESWTSDGEDGNPSVRDSLEQESEHSSSSLTLVQEQPDTCPYSECATDDLKTSYPKREFDIFLEGLDPSRATPSPNTLDFGTYGSLTLSPPPEPLRTTSYGRQPRIALAGAHKGPPEDCAQTSRHIRPAWAPDRVLLGRYHPQTEDCPGSAPSAVVFSEPGTKTIAALSRDDTGLHGRPTTDTTYFKTSTPLKTSVSSTSEDSHQILSKGTVTTTNRKADFDSVDAITELWTSQVCTRRTRDIVP
ncbi:hypothetical protein A0H81_13405 [Grifola frondosa]|uniref:Uncharacterized protein n=1 Tax=Grifola frondosa TaxID=5627 RepID=A0A1C7LPU5_GRIFR|nr:hypothetical protein A0H81_13405 [Grifola frondosa]